MVPRLDGLTVLVVDDEEDTRKEGAHRAFAAGFQMHAPKPVEPNQLFTLVGNLGGRTLE